MKSLSRPLRVLAAGLVLASAAPATEYYVPDDFPTIQAAINGVAATDTIVVRAGTYLENLTFPGFDIVLRSEDGPYLAIIDGGQAGSVVRIQGGEGPAAVLEGFTLTNGTGTLINTYQHCGGGIFVDGSSPTIRGNIVQGNHVDAYGGGIYCQNAALPTITDNVVAQNVSDDDGAGIACWWGSDALIEKNEIRENTTPASAGGIDAVVSAVRVLDNVVRLNVAVGGDGGGIRVVGPTAWPAEVVNNVIHGNHAGSGGGISCYDSDPRITNDTIAENTADLYGGGIEAFYDARPFVANTILWDDSAPIGPEIYVGIDYMLQHPSVLDIGYSDVDGGMGSVVVMPPSSVIWNGPSMINANPAFAAAASGDYHLTYGSPCRNAGNNAASSISATDFEGDPRTAEGVADMGADDFHPHLYCVGTVLPGMTITIKVVGPPGSPFGEIALGSGVLDPPLHLSYGDLWIAPPFPWLSPPFAIPGNGIYSMTGTIPAAFSTNQVVPFQALIIAPGKVWHLTNLMLFW